MTATSDSPQVAVIRRFYQARGKAEAIRQVLSEDVRFEIVEGFPHGGVYEGIDRVLDFFTRLLGDFDEFRPVSSELFEAGEKVIAHGVYYGRAKATGKTFEAAFTHVFTVRDGMVARFQQCADTVQLARALAA